MTDELSLDLFGEEPDPVAAAPGHTPDEAVPAPRPGTPTVDEPRVWSVTQVNRAVRGLLEGSVDPLWVGGEVGTWTRSRAGHCYFTLKDDRAQLRCVMFASDAEQLPADPEEGMQVRAFGALTLYETRGEYQLAVRRLEAEGAEGLWRLAFEKLRKKLEAEGLLDAARKRALPLYPACVGVVTSTSGAALSDIVSTLQRRASWVRVLVRGTRVQGEGASLEIARALEALAATGRCDVIVVGRGGGSVEDLWAFNEEPVARAIAACPVPVVSAVGHEVDVTISDLVADLRAPTPTAAAEAVSADTAVLLGGLRSLPGRLGRALEGAVERKRRRVAEGLWALGSVMDRRLAPVRQTIDRGLGSLEGAVRRRLERRRRELSASAGKLEALSPLGTLARGYAVARDDGERVLRRVADFPAGLDFSLRVIDGSVACRSLGPLGEIG